MQTAEKRHFPAVDHLRGAAILSVLLYHGIIKYPVDLRALYPWCDSLFRLLAAYHMPLFFLLSGFVYSCRGDNKGYLKKRAMRLLVPYLVFGGGSVLLHAGAASLVNGAAGLGEGLRDLALYGGEYWFLYTLFLISAVFPLLDRVRWRPFLPLVAFFTVLIEPVPMPRAFILNKDLYYLGYFILGVLARRSLPRVEKWLSRVRSRPVVWTCGSLLAFLSVFFLLLRLPGFAWRSYIFALFGCTAVIVACTAFSIPERLSNFLRLCGRYSLQLYLLNGYLLVPGRTLLVSVLGIKEPLILVPGLFLFCLAGGLIVSRYIFDSCPFLRVLSGIAPVQTNRKK